MYVYACVCICDEFVGIQGSVIISSRCTGVCLYMTVGRCEVGVFLWGT